MKFEAGQTPYAISRDLGGRPTKQGVAKRAAREGWQVQANSTVSVAAELPIVKRAQMLTGPTKCTAERVAGINPKTLKQWTDQDPQLAEQLRQARAGKLAEWIGHIDGAASRDWKAADRLLQAAPEAEDFSQHQQGGITIVLNIDRDATQGPVIDAEAHPA